MHFCKKMDNYIQGWIKSAITSVTKQETSHAISFIQGIWYPGTGVKNHHYYPLYYSDVPAASRIQQSFATIIFLYAQPKEPALQ
jgi:hypothetical protein